MKAPQMSSPRIAMMLSAFMCPGAGHFYLKHWIGGVFFGGGFVLSACILLVEVFIPLVHNLQVVLNWTAQQMDEPLEGISITKVLIALGFSILFYVAAMMDIARINRNQHQKNSFPPDIPPSN